MPDRVALITGAGRGLGRVMALALLEAGHRVVLSSTHQASLDEVAAESGAGSGRVATLVADLSSVEEAERLAGAAREPFGPIDILINNAGVGIDSLRPNFMQDPYNFWEADRAKIERFFAINAISPMLLGARLAPAMIARKWGRIVANTTSLDTMLRMPLYGGSKAALEAETSVMAHTLAGTGVTANVLIPGGATGTRMTYELGFSRDAMFPDSIMKAPILFLASDESGDFTGRRILAHRWPTALASAEAAAAASDPIAWTGVGSQGVHPDVSKKMFRRESGVGG